MNMKAMLAEQLPLQQSDSLLSIKFNQYKARSAMLVIRYTIERCTLGWVLIAATGRGICAIDIDDDPQALNERLHHRFPKAELLTGEDDFSTWVSGVLRLIEHPHESVTLPLDIQGTAFQQRVWQALREIPPGRTRTYTEIAGQIGQPSAARAVAKACAANELAIIIPCHRVLGKSGKLSGFRWGLARKRTLLVREAEILNNLEAVTRR